MTFAFCDAAPPPPPPLDSTDRHPHPPGRAVHARLCGPGFAGMVKLDAMENPHRLPRRCRRNWASGWARGAEPLPRRPHQRPAQGAGAPCEDARRLRPDAGQRLGRTDLAAGHGLRRAGRSILAPLPGFVMYGMSAQLQGLKFVGVDLTPDFELDEKAMLDAIASTSRPSSTWPTRTTRRPTCGTTRRSKRSSRRRPGWS
jgi:hypothetical protein